VLRQVTSRSSELGFPWKSYTFLFYSSTCECRVSDTAPPCLSNLHSMLRFRSLTSTALMLIIRSLTKVCSNDHFWASSYQARTLQSPSAHLLHQLFTSTPLASLSFTIAVACRSLQLFGTNCPLTLRVDCKNAAQISSQLSAIQLTEWRYEWLISSRNIWVDSPWLRECIMRSCNNVHAECT